MNAAQRARRPRVTRLGLILWCLPAGLLLPTVAAAAAPITSVTETTALRSVGQILATGGSTIAEGTGFIIAPGRVLTAAHVVAGARSITIRLPALGPVPCQQIRSSTRSDLALLACPTAARPAFALASARHDGEAVETIGYPFDGPQRVTHGSLTDSTPNSGGYIVVDAAFDHGNSGGPVIDTAGKVIGVAAAISPQDRASNFAIPTETIRAFLASGPAPNGSTTTSPAAGTSAWPIAAALGGGILIGCGLSWGRRRFRRPAVRNDRVILKGPASPIPEELGDDRAVLVGDARSLDRPDPETTAPLGAEPLQQTGVNHG